jgi:FtsP/CotA-like multicopper oxidase with cupredoxin domain
MCAADRGEDEHCVVWVFEPDFWTLQVWDIVNRTVMDHPFLLHGFFLQAIAVNGEAARVALVGGLEQRASPRHRTDRMAAGRPAGELDVPLPYRREACVWHDGPIDVIA